MLGCHAGRQSTGINMRPARNLWHGPKLAAEIGYPLTHFITINLQQAGCPPEEASQAFRHLLQHRFGKWVTRPRKGEKGSSAPPTFIWALENVEPVGVHAHWAPHVPEGRSSEFRQEVKRWVVEICGEFDDSDGILDFKPVTYLSGLSRYLIAGAHKGVAEFFGAEYEPQGVVVGKRSGTSLNIGETAKRRLRAEGLYPVVARRFVNFASRATPAHAGL